MVAPASKNPAPVHSSSGVPSYSIRISGRTFPRRIRPQSENPLLEIEKSRNSKIVERLLETLPWTKRKLSNFEVIEDLVYGYEDNLRLLELRHQEVSDLLWEVCQQTLSVTLKGFGQDDPRRKQIESMLVKSRFEQAAFNGFKPDSVLSAELIAKPIGEVYQSLDRSIRQTTHRVIQSTFEALDRLVDRSIFGLIEWTSESVCKFHFFKENSVYHRKSNPSSSVQSNWQNVDAVQDIWEVEEVRTSEIEEKEVKSRWRHEHHLMKAEKVILPADSVAVPKDVQPIIEKIPAWLADEAYVVTGEQFREDVIEQKFKDRVWLKEFVKERLIRTVYDPAIVIDKFVLTGWGEEETRQEEARRSDVQTQETRQQEISRFSKSHRTAMNLAGRLGGGGVVAIGLGAFGSWAFTLLGCICIAFSLWYTQSALRSAASFYRVRATPTYLAAGLAAMVFLWCGWALAATAFAGGATLALWIGLGASCLCRPLLRFADSWLPGPLFSLSKN